MLLRTAGDLPELHEPIRALLARHRDRIAALLDRTATEDAWGAPTGCDAWDRRALLLHVRWGHESLAASLDDRPTLGADAPFDPATTPLAYVAEHGTEASEGVAAGLLAAIDGNLGRLDAMRTATKQVRAVWGAPVDFRMLGAHLLWDGLCHELDLLGDDAGLTEDDLAFAATYTSMLGGLGVAMRGVDASYRLEVTEPDTTIEVDATGGVVTAASAPGTGDGTITARLVVEAGTGRAASPPSQALGLPEPFGPAADGFRAILTGGR